MKFGDILAKIANNARLTQEEMKFIRQIGNDTQVRNSQVAGYTTPANQLNIHFPFAPIFSQVLETDTASLTIPIPPGYKHLMLMSAGRTTSAGTSNASLYAQYNGDTSAAYNNQLILGFSSTVSAVADYANTKAVVGELTEDGNTAGKTGTTFTVIPHYRSSLWKTSLTLASPGSGSVYTIFVIQSTWANTSPIETIALSSSLGNIKVGAAISVYGIS